MGVVGDGHQLLGGEFEAAVDALEVGADDRQQAATAGNGAIDADGDGAIAAIGFHQGAVALKGEDDPVRQRSWSSLSTWVRTMKRGSNPSGRIGY
jgi:hypothetical protein